jgi:transposase
MIPSAQEDYAMPNALSADVRSRFEILYREGLSGREAGRRLIISAASASRLAQRIKRGSGLEPAVNPRKTGKGKLAPYSDFFVELVEQDPDITLAELKAALQHAHGVCASISGIDQALRRLGYTYKKRASLRTNAGAPV